MGFDSQLSDTDVLFLKPASARRAEPAQGPAMPLITLPNRQSLTTSIRATAQVFEDPQSTALLARIQLIAPSDANVLIIGETGTGKELIARHVHALSQRADQPFVAVNCGAFPNRWWKANCSAMKKAHLPAPLPPNPAGSRPLMAARCFWMKSATCR